MNPSPRLMSQTEFAAHRGVGKSAVSNWKREDLLIFAECPATGMLKVDVARSEARINARKDPGRGRPKKGVAAQASLPLNGEGRSPEPSSASAAPAAPAGPSFADDRSALVRAQTQKLVLENAKRAGELVPLEAFEARAQEMGRVTRERINSVHRELAERLAKETDARVIVGLLTDEVDAALADLAAQIASGRLAEDGEPEVADDPELLALEAEALAEAEAVD